MGVIRDDVLDIHIEHILKIILGSNVEEHIPGRTFQDMLDAERLSISQRTSFQMFQRILPLRHHAFVAVTQAICLEAFTG